MKRLCFSLIAAFLLVAPAVAEEPKTQERCVIDVGGGMAFYSPLIVLGGELADFDYHDGKKDAPDEVDYNTNFLVVSLGARYVFNSHIEAGLASSYEYYGSYENACSCNGDERKCNRGDFLDHHLVHIAVEGKFNWFTLFDLLRPYSRIGIGTMLEFDNGLESVSLPSVQLTPVGLEFLFPYVSVYAELGAGYRGFMSGGIAFRI